MMVVEIFTITVVKYFWFWKLYMWIRFGNDKSVWNKKLRETKTKKQKQKKNHKQTNKKQKQKQKQKQKEKRKKTKTKTKSIFT